MNRIKQLIDEVLELPNRLSADLETGSHARNNEAHSRFRQDHRILAQYLDELVRQASLIEEEAATSEETGQWAILDFFPNEPVDVYGLFDSEAEAKEYAARLHFDKHSDRFEIRQVLNAHYEDVEGDYAAMGWIGKDGRP